MLKTLVRRTLKIVALGTALTLGMSAHAGLLVWDFSATVVDNVGGDFLGIDGEILSMTLVFDDTDTWGNFDGSFIYVESVSTSVALTGGHTISFSTSDPVAATRDFPSNVVAISEAVGNQSFADFVIDAALTQSLNFSGVNSLIAGDGDTLVAGHLPTSWVSTAAISIVPNSLISDYLFEDVVISITSVPEPGTLGLLGAGLLGLAFARRKKTA